MHWSKKFDLLKTTDVPAETEKGISMDLFDFDGGFSLDIADFEPAFDTFEIVTPDTGGWASATGTGTASTSFSGFASGSGSSSISVSASAYVAPDGSSGSTLSASASGDTVGGTGVAQAGDDVDAFTFDVVELEPASTPTIDLSIYDVSPQIVIEPSTFDFDIWF